MFRKDEQTEVTKKLTRKEQAAIQEQSNKQSSPTKRRGKPTGKRTGGRPCDKLRGMSLSILEKSTKTQTPTRETTNHSDTESKKSSKSEAAEPSSPKRHGIDKLHNRYKGIQTSTDKNISKRLEQVARKTI